MKLMKVGTRATSNYITSFFHAQTSTYLLLHAKYIAYPHRALSSSIEQLFKINFVKNMLISRKVDTNNTDTKTPVSAKFYILLTVHHVMIFGE